MSQHDYDIANAAGATVRSDLNNLFQAIATLNSGATAPTTTFANMFWFDTANNQLKQRDNSNANWIIIASKSGTTWIPYRAGSAIGTGSLLTTDTDGTLAANSDNNVATQKATKTLATTKISKTISGEISAITEKTDLVDDDVFIIEDSENSNAKKKVKYENVGNSSVIEILTSGMTWIAPAGVTKIKITLVGPGGGGGGHFSGIQAAGGGQAGEAIIGHAMNVTPLSSYSYSIGAGGSGGDTSPTNGSDGGDTSFTGDDYTLTATGGDGGSSSGSGGAGEAEGNTNLDGVAGSSTGAGGGVYKWLGGDGGAGGGAGQNGGGGGTSMLGKGGNGGDNNNSTAATDGVFGGGGGGAGPGLSGSGGDGGDGIIIIEYSKG